MDKHVTILGVLLIAKGVLGLLAALVTFWAIAGGGFLSGDSEAFMVTSSVAIFVSGFIAFFSVPDIIAGIGLLNRKNWARILALVLSFLSLLEIPFGTIVGVYGLWVLLKQETINLFEPPPAAAPMTGATQPSGH